MAASQSATARAFSRWPIGRNWADLVYRRSPPVIEPLCHRAPGQFDEEAERGDGVEMDDRGASVGLPLRQHLEYRVRFERAVANIVGRDTDVKNAFAARAQPFFRIAVADAGLDHLQMDRPPRREGVAVGDPALPVAISSDIVGIQ